MRRVGFNHAYYYFKFSNVLFSFGVGEPTNFLFSFFFIFLCFLLQCLLLNILPANALAYYPNCIFACDLSNWNLVGFGFHDHVHGTIVQDHVDVVGDENALLVWSRPFIKWAPLRQTVKPVGWMVFNGWIAAGQFKEKSRRQITFNSSITSSESYSCFIFIYSCCFDWGIYVGGSHQGKIFIVGPTVPIIFKAPTVGVTCKHTCHTGKTQFGRVPLMGPTSTLLFEHVLKGSF